MLRAFRADYRRYDGVWPIHIYLLRGFFLLMFVFVGFDAWSVILTHEGPWNHREAVAWCMFASYSLLSILGVLWPLRMLPIFLFMILYKTLWLLVVAYPLWSSGQLAGSPAEGMARVFAWVPVAIIAVPWRYVLLHYVLGRRS